MARLRMAASILEAAEKWKQECLVDGGSLFAEERLWAEANSAPPSESLKHTSSNGPIREAGRSRRSCEFNLSPRIQRHGVCGQKSHGCIT